MDLSSLAMLLIIELTHTAGRTINGIAKYSNSSNNDARNMEFGSHDGEDGGE